MDQEPGELDGKDSLESGIDGPRTVCAGHGQTDEAGASRHLRMDGRWGRQDTVLQLVRMGANDRAANRGFARADGPSSTDDRRALAGNICPLKSRAEDGING